MNYFSHFFKKSLQNAKVLSITLPIMSSSIASATTPMTISNTLAQVVGLQWLNPLQRKDYTTEWQLLWLLGKVSPNLNDEMVRDNPGKYSTLKPVNAIAASRNDPYVFDGFHRAYIIQLIAPLQSRYFGNPTYFYNVHGKDKKTWRELAGIRVEYSVSTRPENESSAKEILLKKLLNTLQIGNPDQPTLWSRAAPPDIRINTGGCSAGFVSLAKALDYLESHPDETVWVMNWDAPAFPQDEQLNENLVLLVLAGPNYKTGRAPLAWIGAPAVEPLDKYEGRCCINRV